MPRSPTWDRAGASHEPRDPPHSVIREAIQAAVDELADTELYGSASNVEAAEARLERCQRVVDRRDRGEDDHPSDDFDELEDDWSNVVWLDDGEDGHGA